MERQRSTRPLYHRLDQQSAKQTQVLKLQNLSHNPDHYREPTTTVWLQSCFILSPLSTDPIQRRVVDADHHWGSSQGLIRKAPEEVSHDVEDQLG